MTVPGATLVLLSDPALRERVVAVLRRGGHPVATAIESDAAGRPAPGLAIVDGARASEVGGPNPLMRPRLAAVGPAVVAVVRDAGEAARAFEAGAIDVLPATASPLEIEIRLLAA